MLLIDYSGSMYPGYGSDRPQGACPACPAALKDGRPARNDAPYYVATPAFRDLLSGWLSAAPEGRGATAVLLFNAELYALTPTGPALLPPPRPRVPEPGLAYAPADQLPGLLRALPDSPYRTDPRSPDRTETAAALSRALDLLTGGPEGGKDGILWLITDNIVDAATATVSTDDAARNLAFYQLLRDDPRIQWAYAWPLHQPEGCGWMCDTSLILYGLYVSPFERADQATLARLAGIGPGGDPAPDGILWNPAIRDIAATFGPDPARVQAAAGLGGVPLRLKPTDANVLSVRFDPLRCDQSAEYGQPVRCAATATVTNTLRHQSVDGARLSLSNSTITARTGDQPGATHAPWASPICPATATILQWKIRDPAAPAAASAPATPAEGSGSDPIPLGSLPPLGSRTVDVLPIALQPSLPLSGEMIATVTDVTTRLSIPPSAMEAVYGLDSLPAIFQGVQGASLRSATPVQTTLRNNGQLLALVLLGGGLTALSAISLVAARFQRAQYTVLIDGVVVERLNLMRLDSRRIEPNGVHRLTVRRAWSEATLLPADGMRLRTTALGTVLVDRGGEERKVELRRGWNRA